MTYEDEIHVAAVMRPRLQEVSGRAEERHPVAQGFEGAAHRRNRLRRIKLRLALVGRISLEINGQSEMHGRLTKRRVLYSRERAFDRRWMGSLYWPSLVRRWWRLRASGETGRHAGLRSLSRKGWRFKSSLAHSSLHVTGTVL